MKPEQIAAIAVIILILYFIYRLCLSKRNSGSFLPYRKKLLLTKNEWNFYKKLKPVTDKYGYGIIAKVRLADLIEVDTDKTKEFGRFFPKISSKHIDFALINPDNTHKQIFQILFPPDKAEHISLIPFFASQPLSTKLFILHTGALATITISIPTGKSFSFSK